ncbi:MAG TPA: hypothetical protein VGE38_02845 [Nocardioides sp.]|uniref:hypothetical protein n=1 Tax=Nocardioides sp. TaxID=35761 RepID=UPI002ED7A086
MPTSPAADALHALDRALDLPRGSGVGLGNWRWGVRQRLVTVRDRLIGETLGGEEGWLAARGTQAFRERNALLTRLTAYLDPILEAPDAEALRGELKRLARDVGHHLQRVNDLAYDEVELEIGGSD